MAKRKASEYLVMAASDSDGDGWVLRESFDTFAEARDVLKADSYGDGQYMIVCVRAQMTVETVSEPRRTVTTTKQGASDAGEA